MLFTWRSAQAVRHGSCRFGRKVPALHTHAAQLTVEASDSASDFFQKRGFTAEQRNTVSVGNEWLSNTTMKKKLPAKGAAPDQSDDRE